MSGDGRCGGRCGGNQMRAAAGTLAAFEVSVARRGRSFARLELIGIHRQAHAAARLSPFETGFDEDLIESFFLGLLLDQTGTGNDDRANGSPGGRMQTSDA